MTRSHLLILLKRADKEEEKCLACCLAMCCLVGAWALLPADKKTRFTGTSAHLMPRLENSLSGRGERAGGEINEGPGDVC